MGPFANSAAEILEDAAGRRVRLEMVLGVPLHARREPRRRTGFGRHDAHRLDRAVRGGGLDRQAGGQRLDPLIMQGVDRDLLGTREAMQPSARLDANRMGLALRTLARGCIGVEWSIRPGKSCSRWCSVPPRATLSSWKPRQIASSGIPSATAARISGRTAASRAGSSGVPSACGGPP